MAINRRLQFVRGSTARNNAFTGREGELTVDTNTWTLRVHDGVTPGGNPLGTSNFSGSYSDLTDAPTIPADVGDLTDTGGLLFDGTYASLTGTPTIPADVGDLTDTGGLLFDGTYASLTGTPTIPADISDLTDEDNLIPTDLSQLTDATGVIPTDVSELTDTHNIILTLPQIIAGMATEEYVDDAIANLVDTAPGTLNTLNELAAAIGDDPNYASTVAGLIGAKANSADLSTVATSGRYLDLTNKPFIPTDVNELTDASGLLDHFSGSYADLSDKPVLFSGAYADLTGKPTIPTLGNFTLSGNNITASSGADPIVLSIFGSDNGDPLPSLVDRQWSFNTDGSLTLPNGGKLQEVATPGAGSESILKLTLENPVGDPWDMYIGATSIIGADANYMSVYSLEQWGMAADGTSNKISLGHLGSNDVLNVIVGPGAPDGKTASVQLKTNGSFNAPDEPNMFLTANNNTWKFSGEDGSVTFPDSTVQTTAWAGTVSYDNLTDKPTLATVATSGSYNDLDDRPAIPPAIENVSELTNDANYVASDTTGITGADQVTNMVTLTQAEYDAITPNASTVYFIVG